MLTGPRRNINRGIDDIEARMVGEAPANLRDLLDIATYVFVADRMVTRGGDTLPNMGSQWRRRIRLHVAVRDPELWSSPSVKAMLGDLVEFISEDRFTFEFSKSDELPTFPTRLPLRSGEAAPRRRREGVCSIADCRG
jgi:hypothetical protein